MRPLFPIMAVGFLLCASLASAADKTVYDPQNGFSLTYPEQLSNEPLPGEALRLKADYLTCVVSISLYNTSVLTSSSDPKEFIEHDWSPETWKRLIGTAYSKADFSYDKLAQFPDGYPVRLTDMDFMLGDKSLGLYGHSRIALSIRGPRLGYVNCSVMGKSAEGALARWIYLAGPIENVVRSFVLDPR